ncbi:MAG: MT-A70 family methyltransferase [Candidatus Micrarchaeaceae archaeon]
MPKKELVSELKPHPHQGLVPKMTEEEYSALVKDIKLNGILQPIDITPERVILDGHHRVKAAKELGIKEVEVRIPDLGNMSEDEYLVSVALNRRHLTEGQKAMLALEYQKILSARLQSEAGKKAINERWHPEGYVSEDVSETYRSKDSRKIVAEQFKVSEWKLRQANAITQNAPDIVEKVKDGSLSLNEAAVLARKPKEIRDQALKQKIENPRKDVRTILRSLNNEIAVNNPPAPPQGKFAVIYADPPWKYDFVTSQTRAVENHYPTMELGDIKKLPVPAADDAILYLWAPPAKLEDALQVMNAWGFQYKTNMVWIKDRIGAGYYARMRHEILLIGTKGNFGVPAESDRPDSVIEAPRTEHSKKPEIVYEIIEKAYPKHSKIELFARSKRNGWEAWGNEV